MTETQLIAAGFGLSIFFLIWGLYNFLGYRKEKRELRHKYGTMFNRKKERSSFLVSIGDKLDQTEFGQTLKLKLIRANLSLLPSEFFSLLALLGIAGTVLLNRLFSLSLPISVLIAAGVCYLSYRLLFVMRKNKYVEKMSDQLSEVCRILGNSTRAGLTVNQGLEIVASELPNPAGAEFRRLAYNLRLGVNFEKALLELESRVSTKEFNLFVATLLIQRRSGGNLSSVLDEMSKTLEDRKLLSQAIKTMTAESRFVSYILPVMPVVMVLMMNTMMEGFLDPLFTIPGMILTILFVIGMAISFLLVRAVTTIKV